MVPQVDVDMPVVPYGLLGVGEDGKFFDYARGLSPDGQAEFWSQTAGRGREIVAGVRGAGFVVGGELLRPDGQDLGEGGVRCLVYKKGFDGPGIASRCYNDGAIGSVSLWGEGGFVTPPVQVWYRNPSLVDDSLALRDYFVGAGVEFHDAVDLGSLRSEISRLEGLQRVVDRLGSVKLVHLERKEKA